MNYISWGIIAVVAIIALLNYKLIIRILGMVIIPNNGVGIVTKKFCLGGVNTTLPNGKIIALNGEAGIQGDTLAPGLHFWLWPWQFSVQVAPFLTVPDGKLASWTPAMASPSRPGACSPGTWTATRSRTLGRSLRTAASAARRSQ